MKLIEYFKIRHKYKKLVTQVEKMKIYDGRGKGVDVYVCERCGRNTLTRYKDKGVTPFMIKCPYCDGYAQDSDTITERQATMIATINNTAVQNWVRPPLNWLLTKQPRTIDHVLSGGLVLEQEVWDETPHIYD